MKNRFIYRMVLTGWFSGLAFSIGCIFAGALEAEKTCPPQEPIAVTQHTIEFDANSLNYTATAGFLTIQNEDGKTQAEMFFVAYFKVVPDASLRPITFAFNGGPGSSSVWLHLGCMGPMKVNLQKDAAFPYTLVKNPYTWLDLSDLVFIDPIGTGLSHTIDASKAKDYYDINEDIESVGYFIQRFLTEYKRWASPKVLVGESYGTLRAVGLLDELPKKYGIRIDKVVLISAALNTQMISFVRGNDIPYVLYLPSYTAAAWYHGKLNPQLQQTDLQSTLCQVRHWAEHEYLVLLARGDELTQSQHKELTERLATYTGLTKNFIRENHDRINVLDFITELMADKKLQLGLLDSRITGYVVPPETEYNDPSFSDIKPIFASAFKDYLARNLNFHSTRPYRSLSMKVNAEWHWGSTQKGFTDYGSKLSQAIAQNENLKIFAAMGYYDLTTPFATQLYTYNHLGLDRNRLKNLTYALYPSGHQIYTSEDSLKKFKADITTFFGTPAEEQTRIVNR